MVRPKGWRAHYQLGRLGVDASGAAGGPGAVKAAVIEEWNLFAANLRTGSNEAAIMRILRTAEAAGCCYQPPSYTH